MALVLPGLRTHWNDDPEPGDDFRSRLWIRDDALTSWATVDYDGPRLDAFCVRRHGPRRLGEETAAAWSRWTTADRPAFDTFGLDIGADGTRTVWCGARRPTRPIHPGQPNPDVYLPRSSTPGSVRTGAREQAFENALSAAAEQRAETVMTFDERRKDVRLGEWKRDVADSTDSGKIPRLAVVAIFQRGGAVRRSSVGVVNQVSMPVRRRRSVSVWWPSARWNQGQRGPYSVRYAWETIVEIGVVDRFEAYRGDPVAGLDPDRGVLAHAAEPSAAGAERGAYVRLAPHDDYPERSNRPRAVVPGLDHDLVEQVRVVAHGNESSVRESRYTRPPCPRCRSGRVGRRRLHPVRAGTAERGCWRRGGARRSRAGVRGAASGSCDRMRATFGRLRTAPTQRSPTRPPGPEWQVR